MKNITFKKEYQKYIALVILSVITGGIEYYGFLVTDSNTLGIAMLHMLFHAVFFSILAVFSFHIENYTIEKQQKIETITAYSIIALVVILGIFRIHEILDHTFQQMFFGDMTMFRIILGILTGLIFLQWYILHIPTKNSKDTCGALCHGSEGHLGIDLVGFIILFGVSFFGSFITSIADILLFAVSGLVLIGTIFRITKNINKKYPKRVT